MFAVVKKELRQYFSGLLGYMTIAVFLLLTGLVLFVLPESGILDLGYATMDSFFFQCSLCHVDPDSWYYHEKF